MKIPWKKPGRLHGLHLFAATPRHPRPGRDCAFETAPFGGAVSLLHAGAAATCARGDGKKTGGDSAGSARFSEVVGGTNWWFPI